VLGGLDLAPYVHDDASLALVAADFLAGLPALLRDDVATWSVAVAPAHRRRHVRLVVTRVKPAVRAVLATHGTAPTTAYAADWAAMADALAHVDTGAGARLHALRAALPADDDAAGGFACELGLALLADVVRLS